MERRRIKTNFDNSKYNNTQSINSINNNIISNKLINYKISKNVPDTNKIYMPLSTCDLTTSIFMKIDKQLIFQTK